MMIHSKYRWSLVGGIGAAAWFWAGSASALDCASDTDCPKGFTCEVSQATDCGDARPCIEGEACEPVACDPVEVRSCMSVDCADDSDCAADMACETIVSESCADVACPADGDCPDVESSCEREERNYCVPRYQLPCEVAADCGAGFDCVEQESCWCSGSSGGSEPSPGAPDSAGGEEMPEPLPPDDADADAAEEAPDAEEACGCEPTGEFACQLEMVECTSDSHCPAGFACGDNPEGGECWESSDGDSGCSEPDPAKVCLPPYLDLYEGRDYVGSESGDSSAPVSGGVDREDGGESGPNADDDAGSSAASDSGGCSVSGGSRPAPLGAVSLLLASGLLLRRRRLGTR